MATWIESLRKHSKSAFALLIFFAMTLSMFIFMTVLFWERLVDPTLLYVGESLKIACFFVLLVLNTMNLPVWTIGAAVTHMGLEAIPIVHFVKLRRMIATTPSPQSPAPIVQTLTLSSISFSFLITFLMIVDSLLTLFIKHPQEVAVEEEKI